MPMPMAVIMMVMMVVAMTGVIIVVVVGHGGYASGSALRKVDQRMFQGIKNSKKSSSAATPFSTSITWLWWILVLVKTVIRASIRVRTDRKKLSMWDLHVDIHGGGGILGTCREMAEDALSDLSRMYGGLARTDILQLELPHQPSSRRHIDRFDTTQ